MGAVQGQVRTWLRIEGMCVLLAAILLYRHFGYGWGIFVLCFMAPDLSMLAYAAGPRIGAMVYNAAHSYLGPVLLLAWSIAGGGAHWQLVLIWFAHIGFCRVARFGLKYTDNFDHTHLGQAPFNLPEFLLGLVRRKA